MKTQVTTDKYSAVWPQEFSSFTKDENEHDAIIRWLVNQRSAIFLINENLIQLENMVIRYRSSATIPKLIIVRDILQQVLIFFIKWCNWVLIISEYTFETIALLFWLELKGLCWII